MGVSSLFSVGQKGKGGMEAKIECGLDEGIVCAETGTRTPTSSMGSSNSTLELFQPYIALVLLKIIYHFNLETRALYE